MQKRNLLGIILVLAVLVGFTACEQKSQMEKDVDAAAKKMEKSF